MLFLRPDGAKDGRRGRSVLASPRKGSGKDFPMTPLAKFHRFMNTSARECGNGTGCRPRARRRIGESSRSAVDYLQSARDCPALRRGRVGAAFRGLRFQPAYGGLKASPPATILRPVGAKKRRRNRCGPHARPRMERTTHGGLPIFPPPFNTIALLFFNSLTPSELKFQISSTKIQINDKKQTKTKMPQTTATGIRPMPFV